MCQKAPESTSASVQRDESIGKKRDLDTARVDNNVL